MRRREGDAGRAYSVRAVVVYRLVERRRAYATPTPLERPDRSTAHARRDSSEIATRAQRPADRLIEPCSRKRANSQPSTPYYHRTLKGEEGEGG